MMEYILTNIIFLPLFSALILGLFRANIKMLKAGAILSSLTTFALVLLLILKFNPNAGMQFIIHLP